MADRPAVSVLIVNWNSKDLLRQCLLSIRRTCVDMSVQTIVVDGGSFDGCGEMVGREFPEVEFIQSPDNVGFGCANNLGLSRVTGETVLILNPDTELEPGALQTLLAELRRLPDAGIVSPRLLNPDRTLQTSVHALPRPVRQAFDSELLRRVLSPYSLWAPPSSFAPRETVAVEAVAGTCMLMWARTFRDVGAFTPRYFMYAEDMDLCFKVSRAGHAIYHVPHAAVLHHGGASTSTQGTHFAVIMIREALHLYMTLNHGPGHALAYRCATAASALVRLSLIALSLAVPGHSNAKARRLAWQRWQSILSWSCGRQRWAERYAAPHPAR